MPKVMIEDTEYELDNFSDQEKLIFDRISFAQANLDVITNGKVAMIHALEQSLATKVPVEESV